MTDLVGMIFSAFKAFSCPDRNNIAVYARNLEYEALEDFIGLENNKISVEFLVPKHRQSLLFMAKSAFYYYLPAYMKVAIQDYDSADTIPGMLINLFTLPIAQDWDKLKSFMREQTIFEDHSTFITPGGTIDDVGKFHERFYSLDIVQKQAIRLFLETIRDEHGEDFSCNTPQVAIENYWDQF